MTPYNVFVCLACPKPTEMSRDAFAIHLSQVHGVEFATGKRELRTHWMLKREYQTVYWWLFGDVQAEQHISVSRRKDDL